MHNFQFFKGGPLNLNENLDRSDREIYTMEKEKGKGLDPLEPGPLNCVIINKDFKYLQERAE